jgi:hypothetical protein
VARERDFCLFVASSLTGNQPALYKMGTGAVSLGIKWQGREADHLPRFSAKVKNGGAIPPLPHMLSWHSA